MQQKHLGTKRPGPSFSSGAAELTQQSGALTSSFLKPSMLPRGQFPFQIRL